MDIIKNRIVHTLILIGALILALSLRLTKLGAMPLTNLEAEITLQANAVSQGTDVVFGEHIAYVGLTGVDFFIFEVGNFLARFWPAVIGAVIVFIPFLFRDLIGPWPASILSFILAVTPEMVGLSRIIGTPMIAFVSLFVALGLICKGKPILSGMAFALALLGGSGFWTGILLSGLGLLLSEKVFDFKILPQIRDIFSDGKFLIRFIAAWVLTIAVVGTGFFLSPQSLSGVFSGLVNFVRGFGVSYTRPFFLRPLALAAYSLPAIAFGIWGGIRGVLLRNKLDIFLFIMAFLGFLFLLLFPGAQPADIVWVTLPLWALSARVVCSVWQLPEGDRLVMIGTAVVVVIIFAFLLLTLRSLVNPGFVQDTQIITLIALFGGFIILIALILLVTFGWSEEIAISGLMIGLSVVVILGMIAGTIRSTGLSSEDKFELWYPNEPQLSTRWLKTSIDRVLNWNKRRAEPVEIVVVDFSTPGMRWIMQEYDDVAFVPYSPPASQPGMVISDIVTQPEISNSYRGQDLVWSRSVLWEEMSAMDYSKWLITREVPVADEELIFWVRTDLMPDEQFSQ
jgi:hypothetical protein